MKNYYGSKFIFASSLFLYYENPNSYRDMAANGLNSKIFFDIYNGSTWDRFKVP